MWIMFSIVVTAWTVIGFILWIPLLVRATTVFSAMLVHACFTRQHPDVLRSHLESASRFYPDGFRIAYDVVHLPSTQYSSPPAIRFGRVFAECAWTLVFWTLLLTLFHPIWLFPRWAKISLAGTTFGSGLMANQFLGVFAVLGITGILGIVLLRLMAEKKHLEAKRRHDA